MLSNLGKKKNKKEEKQQSLSNALQTPPQANQNIHKAKFRRSDKLSFKRNEPMSSCEGERRGMDRQTGH